MTLNRRCVIAAGLLSLAGFAQAQHSGPIKMIIPFGPGTTTDTVARVGAEALGAPVAFIGSAPTLLVVATNSPAKSLKDLAAMAARPEGVSFASAGNGTSGHLAGELRALAASDVQTLMEQGVQAFDLVAWFMLYAAEEMLPFNKTEFVKWAELVKRSGAQVD